MITIRLACISLFQVSLLIDFHQFDAISTWAETELIALIDNNHLLIIKWKVIYKIWRGYHHINCLTLAVGMSKRCSSATIFSVYNVHIHIKYPQQLPPIINNNKTNVIWWTLCAREEFTANINRSNRYNHVHRTQ